MNDDKRQQPLDLDEPFVRVDAEEARKLIEAGAELIDVRQPDEYADGHIPGARLVPLGDFLAQPRDYVKHDNVVFVCAVGARSAVACEMAAAIGFTQVYNLEGGTNGWASEGRPIEV